VVVEVSEIALLHQELAHTPEHHRKNPQNYYSFYIIALSGLFSLMKQLYENGVDVSGEKPGEQHARRIS